MTIEHHFLPGLYAKRTHIPAGHVGMQHAHTYDHCSVLVKGSAMVGDGVTYRTHHAPAHIVIPAGQQHEVRALTDIEWWCIHATDETDPAKVDEVLVCRG